VVVDDVVLEDVVVLLDVVVVELLELVVAPGAVVTVDVVEVVVEVVVDVVDEVVLAVEEVLLVVELVVLDVVDAVELVDDVVLAVELVDDVDDVVDAVDEVVVDVVVVVLLDVVVVKPPGISQSSRPVPLFHNHQISAFDRALPKSMKLSSPPSNGCARAPWLFRPPTYKLSSLLAKFAKVTPDVSPSSALSGSSVPLVKIIKPPTPPTVESPRATRNCHPVWPSEYTGFAVEALALLPFAS
jgi:hypothetical protein